jgi:hypothetical protein
MFKYCFLLWLIVAACNSPAQDIRLTGTLIKPEATAYMYGTHALQKNNQIAAALQSKSINLDNFIGKKVRIRARKLEGYPLDGGPVFLEVIEIKIIE